MTTLKKVVKTVCATEVDHIMVKVKQTIYSYELAMDQLNTCTHMDENRKCLREIEMCDNFGHKGVMDFVRILQK